jgi:hypothetical protein
MATFIREVINEKFVTALCTAYSHSGAGARIIDGLARERGRAMASTCYEVDDGSQLSDKQMLGHKK